MRIEEGKGSKDKNRKGMELKADKEQERKENDDTREIKEEAKE